MHQQKAFISISFIYTSTIVYELKENCMVFN